VAIDAQLTSLGETLSKTLARNRQIR